MAGQGRGAGARVNVLLLAKKCNDAYGEVSFKRLMLSRIFIADLGVVDGSASLIVLWGDKC